MQFISFHFISNEQQWIQIIPSQLVKLKKLSIQSQKINFKMSNTPQSISQWFMWSHQPSRPVCFSFRFICCIEVKIKLGQYRKWISNIQIWYKSYNRVNRTNVTINTWLSPHNRCRLCAFQFRTAMCHVSVCVCCVLRVYRGSEWFVSINKFMEIDH